jgi:hypothetical protein
MSDWHGCCNTASRENDAFKVLREPTGLPPRGDFGRLRCGQRECGYSFALSIPPNTALSQPLYYDGQRFDHRLAKGRYADTRSLIFLSARGAF